MIMVNGHMAKMIAMLIYGKNTLKLLFPGINGPTLTKLGMKHQILKPNILCSNDNPGLTMTYFTSRSNFAIIYKAFYMGKCDNDGFFDNHPGIWFIEQNRTKFSYIPTPTYT